MSCAGPSSSLAASFSNRLRHDLRLSPYCRRADGVWLDRAGTLVKVIAVELGIIESIGAAGRYLLQKPVIIHCKVPY